MRVSKGGRHQDRVPPFETLRFAELLRVRWALEQALGRATEQLHARHSSRPDPGDGAHRRLLPVGLGGQDQAGAQARRHPAGLAGHADHLARHRRPCSAPSPASWCCSSPRTRATAASSRHDSSFVLASPVLRGRCPVIRGGGGRPQSRFAPNSDLKFSKIDCVALPLAGTWALGRGAATPTRLTGEGYETALDGRPAGAGAVGSAGRRRHRRALRRRLRARQRAGTAGRRNRHRRRQAARDGDARARGGGSQSRADRPQARHGDRHRRGPAVRAHDLAARRRDRRTARRRGLHRRLAGSTPSAATSPSTRSMPTPTARSTTRSTAAPTFWPAACASSAIPTSASPRTACACCASSASMPGSASRRSTARASTPAAATPARLSSLSGERVAKELLRLLAAPAPADALEAMAEAGALDHWLPEYAGAARLKRADRPRARGRARSAAPPGGDPVVAADATAIGKRLKLSTQQALRLQLMLEPAVAGDRSNRRAALYRLGTSLFIDRVLLEGPDDWRAALALARTLDAAGIADRAAPMRWRSASNPGRKWARCSTPSSAGGSPAIFPPTAPPAWPS